MTALRRPVAPLVALLALGLGLGLALGPGAGPAPAAPVARHVPGIPAAAPANAAWPGVESVGDTRGAVDYSDVVATLRASIPRTMRETGAVGVTIALVDGQRVVWQQGFGYADKASGRRVTADTLFHIGSASKTLSAIAVMQLVERGLVDLDRPLADYVPGFALLPRYHGDRITVRTVLDHHSGIPGDVFNGLITTGRPDRGFRSWLAKALRAMYPEHPVNTVYAYNNSGYVLLQALVEHVTGQPFEAYAQAHLFGPMGMSSSRFDDTRAPAGRLTRNYAVTTDGSGAVSGAVAKPREYVNGWTAGSVTSSARDMADYLRTLLAGGATASGRILRQATLRRMWTPATHEPLDIIPVRFGLGFALGDPQLDWAGRVVWHDGATAWNFTMLQLLPDAGLGVFVSTNTLGAGPVSPVIAGEALTLAYEAKSGRTRPGPLPLPLAPEASIPAAELDAHVGSYAGSFSLYQVAHAESGLTLVSDVGTAGQASTALTPRTDGWFSAADGSVAYAFQDIEGRRLLLMRLVSGTGPVTRLAAQRLPETTLTDGWRARLGTYRAVDRVPNVDASLVAWTIRLRAMGSLLIGDFSSESGTQALAPGPAGTMCTYGLGFALGRQKGDCLIPFTAASGAPGFVFMGVRYVRSGAGG